MEIDPYVKIYLYYASVFLVTLALASLLPIWIAGIAAIGFAGALWYCLNL